jgi:2-haloacid dehalogenase
LPPRGDIECVVFDVGGVLVDWDPRHLYRKVFDDPDEMERFLAEVCTWEWHHEHDRGARFADTIPALSIAFPEHAPHIAMWESRYLEMIPGPIAGMPELVRDLHAVGTRLLLLSNMPSETWEPLTAMFDWFELFEGAVVSGDELVVKPDPAIYRVLVDRFGVDPARTTFVDDRIENVEAAQALGFDAVLFQDAASLRALLLP